MGCQEELQGFGERASEIKEQEARLVAICVDTPEALATFSQNYHPDFIFLSDQEKEAITAYDLLRPTAYEGRDVAQPAAFIIDKQGVVRWAHVGSNLFELSNPEEVMRGLKEIEKPRGEK